MTISVHAPGVAISASTTSAQGTIPASSAKYLRVVNPTTAICYVNAGSNPTATASNIAVGAYSTDYLERDVNTDTVVAVLLSTGTGTISVSPVAQAE